LRIVEHGQQLLRRELRSTGGGLMKEELGGRMEEEEVGG